MTRVHIFLVIVSMLHLVHSARILCVSMVSFLSHQAVLRSITEELGKRGHEVFVLTRYPRETAVDNVTDEDFQISHNEYDVGLIKFNPNMQKAVPSILHMGRNMINPLGANVFRLHMTNKAVQNWLLYEKEKFDLIITEPCFPHFSILSHFFNAPIVYYSALVAPNEEYQLFGAPAHPFYYPEMWNRRFINITTFDKISIVFENILISAIRNEQLENENRLLRNVFTEAIPSRRELTDTYKLLILNVPRFWDNNRPVPRNVLYAGPVDMIYSSEMSNDLQNYLDSSTLGVICISFGSTFQISELPSHIAETIFTVLSEVPYDIVMKWDGTEIERKPKNIRFEKMLPQKKIMAHPNTKLLINHGGMLSIIEAMSEKVPIIALPLFGDQFFNAQKVAQFGVGVQLDIDKLDEELFRETIIDTAESTTYRENAEKMSQLMNDKQYDDFESIVYWIEYILRHNTNRIRSPLADVSFAEYFMLDLMSAVLSFATLCFVFTYALMKLCKRLLNLYFYNK